MQILTGNHWTEVGEPYGRVKRKTEAVERNRNSVRRSTVSNKPPIKMHTWASLRP